MAVKKPYVQSHFEVLSGPEFWEDTIHSTVLTIPQLQSSILLNKDLTLSVSPSLIFLMMPSLKLYTDKPSQGDPL